MDVMISPSASITCPTISHEILNDKYFGFLLRESSISKDRKTEKKAKIETKEKTRENKKGQTQNFYLYLYRHKNNKRIIFHQFKDMDPSVIKWISRIVAIDKKRDLLILQNKSNARLMIWMIEGSNTSRLHTIDFADHVTSTHSDASLEMRLEILPHVTPQGIDLFFQFYYKFHELS